MKRKTVFPALIVTLAAAFVVINNCQIFPAPDRGTPKFLAHRGLAQNFDISRVNGDTNTASIIYPPEYPYIENTILSMEAAFSYGADIVEFDIRMTKDKELAVFHDYLVEFRTDGTGNVSDYTLSDLKRLDVGYGYTADNGKTYPLRGTGIGLLPSFEEVMARFPDRKFLVHIRDGGDNIGRIFLEKLKRLDARQIRNITLYGNDAAIELIRKEFPGMQAVSLRLMKRALIEYELIGWTGFVPGSLRNLELHLPLEYAKYLWGWPYKFTDRMNRVNTRVVLVKKTGQWSGGFDTETDLRVIPEHFDGYIWTERIDRTGNLYNF